MQASSCQRWPPLTLCFCFPFLKKEKSKSSSSTAREPNGFPADTSANSSLLLEFQGELAEPPLSWGRTLRAHGIWGVTGSCMSSTCLQCGVVLIQ